MDYPKRKNPRLAAFDYSAPNIYFLTLCTRGRSRCLSRIVGRGLDPAVPFCVARKFPGCRHAAPTRNGPARPIPKPHLP